jgi:hypothetical protein
MPTDSKTFYSESDLPLAKHDAIVDVELDHGVKVQRKVIAGTRVPPDLIDAYTETTGDTPTEAADEQSSSSPDYGAMNVEELQALVDERELEVAGTGKDGNVVKADLVKALQNSDSSGA